ncbi:MAG: MBL fold metallo-hydrolase [Gammaproteobacteria bacterium]|nr:MBL fold metallo-hydrolase [Gammaproteobacteria bacterium]
MLRFSSLGSGSRGNATLVEAGNTCVMVDCGFSVSETQRRLVRLGKSPGDIHAILVTHEHSDHIGGVAAFARRFGIPVWMTAGTSVMLNATDFPSLDGPVRFDGHTPFAIGDLQVTPFPVPHDAREPCQFVLSDGAVRLGVLTDTGSITAHIHQQLTGCQALLLECNHDAAMLADGPYPPSLKQRVGGRLGHLSNHQAAELLAALDTSQLTHLVAAHLSDKNNRSELARQALADALGCDPGWIGVADQTEGLAWRQVG